jgi:thioester reductase-like protein
MEAPPHSHPGVLLTGATGFLGGEVLARLLKRGDRRVYALVRAESDDQAGARLRETIRSLMGTIDPWSHRVTAVAADLQVPELGLAEQRREWLAERVSSVIHSAATVSFELGLEESRGVNVEGTRRVLDLAEFASVCGGLECFTHISTAYVAGDHSGRFGEGDLAVGQRFRNAYEQSKFEAETIVRERSLPVQVLRPSIVVGDSNTGWTPSFNVIYWPLRAFAKGSYPALPFRRSALVDVVPVDYVASAVLALAGRPGTTYHLVAGDDASEVGEVVELASSYLRSPPPRLIPPPLYRRLLHPLLVRTGSKRRRRALRRSERFFPYFEVGTRYDDRLAREALAPHGIEAPPLASYFNRLMDYALLAKWGRRPRARHRMITTPSTPPQPDHGRARLPSMRWRPRPAPISTRSRSESRRSSRDARTA